MPAPARKPGRPAGTTKPDSRRHILRVRLSPEETERIESAARVAQTTVSEYVRGRAMEEIMPATNIIDTFYGSATPPETEEEFERDVAAFREIWPETTDDEIAELRTALFNR